MRTKIRLVSDCIIQLLLLFLVSWQIFRAPSDALLQLSWFTPLFISWQLIHALYVVQKYNDWYRSRYLSWVKQLFLYGIAGSAIAFLLSGTQLFQLLPFSLILVKISGLAVLGLLLLTGLHNMWLSYYNLYAHWVRPKSFWDL
jgi:hypothetical protein